jgi:hypothetical protein
MSAYDPTAKSGAAVFCGALQSLPRGLIKLDRIASAELLVGRTASRECKAAVVVAFVVTVSRRPSARISF